MELDVFACWHWSYPRHHDCGCLRAHRQLAPSTVEPAAAYASLDRGSGTDTKFLQDACEQKVHSCKFLCKQALDKQKCPAGYEIVIPHKYG